MGFGWQGANLSLQQDGLQYRVVGGNTWMEESDSTGGANAPQREVVECAGGGAGGDHDESNRYDGANHATYSSTNATTTAARAPARAGPLPAAESARAAGGAQAAEHLKR